MNRKEFITALGAFQCQRCLECCKKPGFVYLDKEEPQKIARYLNMDEFDFVNQYCELLDRQRMVLKKHTDESCVFLNSDGCRIHPVKPVQCRDFPVRWRTPASYQYCEGLKKILPNGFREETIHED